MIKLLLNCQKYVYPDFDDRIYLSLLLYGKKTGSGRAAGDAYQAADAYFLY